MAEGGEREEDYLEPVVFPLSRENCRNALVLCHKSWDYHGQHFNKSATSVIFSALFNFKGCEQVVAEYVNACDQCKSTVYLPPVSFIKLLALCRIASYTLEDCGMKRTEAQEYYSRATNRYIQLKTGQIIRRGKITAAHQKELEDFDNPGIIPPELILKVQEDKKIVLEAYQQMHDGNGDGKKNEMVSQIDLKTYRYVLRFYSPKLSSKLQSDLQSHKNMINNPRLKEIADDLVRLRAQKLGSEKLLKEVGRVGLAGDGTASGQHGVDEEKKSGKRNRKSKRKKRGCGGAAETQSSEPQSKAEVPPGVQEPQQPVSQDKVADPHVQKPEPKVQEADCQPQETNYQIQAPDQQTQAPDPQTQAPDPLEAPQSMKQVTTNPDADSAELDASLMQEGRTPGQDVDETQREGDHVLDPDSERMIPSTNHDHSWIDQRMDTLYDDIIRDLRQIKENNHVIVRKMENLTSIVIGMRSFDAILNFAANNEAIAEHLEQGVITLFGYQDDVYDGEEADAAIGGIGIEQATENTMEQWQAWEKGILGDMRQLEDGEHGLVDRLRKLAPIYYFIEFPTMLNIALRNERILTQAAQNLEDLFRCQYDVMSVEGDPSVGNLYMEQDSEGALQVDPKDPGEHLEVGRQDEAHHQNAETQQCDRGQDEASVERLSHAGGGQGDEPSREVSTEATPLLESAHTSAPQPTHKKSKKQKKQNRSQSGNKEKRVAGSAAASSDADKDNFGELGVGQKKTAQVASEKVSPEDKDIRRLEREELKIWMHSNELVRLYAFREIAKITLLTTLVVNKFSLPCEDIIKGVLPVDTDYLYMDTFLAILTFHAPRTDQLHVYQIVVAVSTPAWTTAVLFTDFPDHGPWSEQKSRTIAETVAKFVALVRATSIPDSSKPQKTRFIIPANNHALSIIKHRGKLVFNPGEYEIVPDCFVHYYLSHVISILSHMAENLHPNLDAKITFANSAFFVINTFNHCWENPNFEGRHPVEIVSFYK